MARHILAGFFIFCRAALLLGLVSVACLSQAASPRHVLNYSKHTKGVTVQVYDRKIKKSVWRRTFDHAGQFVWSPDRTCLAVEVMGSDYAFGLLTWRVGQSPRLLSKQPVFQDNDGILEMRWSPDNRKLLLLTWAGGGGGDFRMGRISVLDLSRGRFFIPPISASRGNVRRVRWQNNRVIRFWKVSKRPGIDGFPLTEKRSHLMRCSDLLFYGQ